jgi:Ca2+-binding EF-hand superfamily protein
VRKLSEEFMSKYDKSKTGTLNRAEVKKLADDLLKGTGFGVTDEEVDMIMRCAGDDTRAELDAKDLPMALAVVEAVRQDAENFHALFLKHDRDKSGVLPAGQLGTLLAEINEGGAPSASDLDYILKQCEPRGKDDPINESQLKSAIACWYCLCEPAHEKIKATFKAWDTHNTGFISFDELKAVMKRLNASMSDDDLTALFKSIDTHRSGRIEYDEFVEWVLGGTGDKPTTGSQIAWSDKWMEDN